MTSQKIVPPSKIESELVKIWESLNKENTNKACLFTLIVFSERNKRLNYIRDTIQNIIEKFPCRIIFITYEPKAKESYLKTAVSILFPPGEEKEIACDSIDIGVGNDDIEKVKYVILPLLLTDLPTHLFWCEDPRKDTKLLFQLKELVSKIIFDSETTDNIFEFSKFITQNFSDKKNSIVDLNWLKTEDLRDIIASEFYNCDKLKILKGITSIAINANKAENLFLEHFLLQTYYVVFWLSARLEWSLKKRKADESKHCFIFESQKSEIQIIVNIEANKSFSSGDMLKIHLQTNEGNEVTFTRTEGYLNAFRVESSSKQQCDLPHNFNFKKFELGHFLADEMITHKANDHFMQTLTKLSDIQNG